MSTLCRFFAKGRCTRGAACAFRHETAVVPLSTEPDGAAKSSHVWNPAAKPFSPSLSVDLVPPHVTERTDAHAQPAGPPAADSSAIASTTASIDAPQSISSAPDVKHTPARPASDHLATAVPSGPIDVPQVSQSGPCASDTPRYRPPAANAPTRSPASPLSQPPPDLSHVVVATRFPRAWTADHLRTHILQCTAAVAIQEIRIMSELAPATAGTAVDLVGAFQRAMSLDDAKPSDTCAFIVFETGAGARSCLGGQSSSNVVHLSPCALAGRPDWPPFAPPPDLPPQRRAGQYVISSMLLPGRACVCVLRQLTDHIGACHGSCLFQFLTGACLNAC
jgi:hypothetical protein